jgi:signal transduction histidine kinase
VLVSALATWVVVSVSAFAFSADSTGRGLVMGIGYSVAAAFALVLLIRAVQESVRRERLIWTLLAAGLAFTIVGDLGWSVSRTSGGFGPVLSFQQAAYLISYLLFAAGSLLLVRMIVSEIAGVTTLDALAVMLSSGTLAWFFLVDGESASLSLSAILSWVVFDAALLFLALVMISVSGGSATAKLLAAGFLAFLVADTLYLDAGASGMYGFGGIPYLAWTLGVVLIGGSALWPSPTRTATTMTTLRISPWRIFAFWFGPLSPPLHFVILLVWCALLPPPPGYVLAGAAALLLYLGLRVALVSFVTRRLSAEQEAATRKVEQGRVLLEMHDTVKQSIHGIALSADAALEADRRGERGRVREMLGRTLAASREAEYKVSQPYDELRVFQGEGSPSITEHLSNRLDKFEQYFGVTTHKDFQSPLDVLDAAEIAVVYRVVVEAFWNVAKHAQARNMHLESRRVGRTLILRVRDDGRGFDAASPPPGMGLAYMRQRAGEVGAKLDVISTPGRGACIQLRFDKG